MKKTNKNNNHKFLSKNYIKGAISGALALTILCSGVGVAAYSAGADNTAQALGVQTESTVEAVKKASTTKEALKKLSKNETVYVIADANGAAKKIIVSDWLKGVDTKGKVKDVSKQIHANPKVEICAYKNGEWLRVAGELVEDDRREARQSMLDAYPSLQNMYSADDGNTEVFYFKNATATFSSFTHEPEVVKF